MLYVFLGQVIGEMGLHCDMEMIPVKTYVFILCKSVTCLFRHYNGWNYNLYLKMDFFLVVSITDDILHRLYLLYKPYFL